MYCVTNLLPSKKSQFLSVLCTIFSSNRRRANTDDTNDTANSDDSTYHETSDSDDDSEVEDVVDSTAIKFILVNPKSLQECKITYNDAHDIKSASNGIVKSEPFEDDVVSSNQQPPKRYP